MLGSSKMTSLCPYPPLQILTILAIRVVIAVECLLIRASSIGAYRERYCSKPYVKMIRERRGLNKTDVLV